MSTFYVQTEFLHTDLKKNLQCLKMKFMIYFSKTQQYDFK